MAVYSDAGEEDFKHIFKDYKLVQKKRIILLQERKFQDFCIKTSFHMFFDVLNQWLILALT